MGFIKHNLDLTPIYKSNPLKNNRKRRDKIFIKKHLKSKEYKKYKKIVDNLTKKNLPSLKNIELRGWKKYHVDHKISIYYGFLNNIEPIKISHISNIRMLYYKDNMKKGITNYIDKDNKWILSNCE